MRRLPHDAPRLAAVVGPSPTEFIPDQWVDYFEVAQILKKFKRGSREPSVGAIRNMVYRRQLTACMLFGRRLINRKQFEDLIAPIPFKRRR